MNHIEILNEDVEYFATFNDVPCCNGCNDGGGGCGCQTYVCTAYVPVCVGCDTNTCSGCNVDTCGLFNY